MARKHCRFATSFAVTSLTLADASRCHCGVIKYIIPSKLPSSVSPRPSNTSMITYGNVDVMYVT